MIRHLDQDHLSADLAAVEDLLASAPSGDVLGRLRLTERRDEILHALAEVSAQPDCFDPPERAREKQFSRDADAHALASGEKRRDELRRENGYFAFPSSPSSRT